MRQKHEVKTEAAYITGLVKVGGLQDRVQPPDATIIAKYEERVTSDTVPCGKAARPYFLVVFPGECRLTAEVGGVISDTQVIKLEPGETAEIDFYFGKLE
jgi:hypothetical protein